jgi:hypothetical protein
VIVSIGVLRPKFEFAYRVKPAGWARDPRAAAKSSGSKIGGWQENPEHNTANDRGSPKEWLSLLSAGKFGIVFANAGGRFSATVLSASRRNIAVPKAKGLTAARYNSAAALSFPTTTTWACGWTKRDTANP